MPELELVRTVAAHSGQSNCVALAVSPDGKRVAVGASDALCFIWSIHETICERNLGRLDYHVRAVAFTYDSQLIATGSEDHCIDIAYVNDGSRVHEIRLEGEVYSAAWHPQQLILALHPRVILVNETVSVYDYLATPVESDLRNKNAHIHCCAYMETFRNDSKYPN
ncbi:hypothetical protein KIN20_022904 [Parelaphostrongylus tenuis]|nr:hypothetical protein KIN20_022904 [Parelaphostrongylus tenuis]